MTDRHERRMYLNEVMARAKARTAARLNEEAATPTNLTGTCPTCGRDGLRLTKAGRVWNHRDPKSRLAQGAFGMNCLGGKPAV